MAQMLKKIEMPMFQKSALGCVCEFYFGGEGRGGKGRGLKSIIYLILMVSHLHYHKNSEQKIARCRLEQSYPMGYAAWIHVGTDTAAILVSLLPCVGAYNQPHITNAFIMNHSIVAAGYHFT